MTANSDRWADVDRYVADVLVGLDEALDEAIRASDAAGLPAIAVTPAQGKFLWLLARARGARRVLEIGTLGAYSTIWLARAVLPGGRVTTLELNPRHADVARANLARAGLGDSVEVVVGPAANSLERLAAGGAPPFDLVFIDADKQGYPEYLRLSVPLCSPGALIVADNVVRDGAVADAASTDEQVQAVRAYNAAVAAHPRLSGTILQTVGAKGYDGFAIALVAG